MSAIGNAKSAAWSLASPLLQAIDRQGKGALYTAQHSNLDPDRHLSEAIAWLERAQDHGNDRGVSYGSEFGNGFLPSYPETTGYIICTFVDLGRRYAEQRYLRRAFEMGKWEAEIQMSCGAVMSGMYGSEPAPAIFNTGMVLLGWADLVRQENGHLFVRAGKRAAQWLIDMQESDGSWTRANSALANPSGTLYNVKAAWGLAEMGAALGEDAFIRAAVRNAEYTVSRQLHNGWFPDCSLDDVEQPVLHTIGYAMQGLIGVGKISQRTDFVAAAARTAKSLMRIMDGDGSIPGRLDRNFSGTVDWSCLTGIAQTSIVFSELEQQTGDRRYAHAAEVANRYLMARHDISNRDPSLRGGVAGSWPVWAWRSYGKLHVLNWATKFFVDALLLRSTPRQAMASTVLAEPTE